MSHHVCSFSECFTAPIILSPTFQALPLLSEPLVLWWSHLFPCLTLLQMNTSYHTHRHRCWIGTSNPECPKWNSLSSLLHLPILLGFLSQLVTLLSTQFLNFEIIEQRVWWIVLYCITRRDAIHTVVSVNAANVVQCTTCTTEHGSPPNSSTTCSVISMVIYSLIFYNRLESVDNSQFIGGPHLNIHDTLSQFYL